MLIRYGVENFRSFRDREELTLVAGSQKELPDARFAVTGFPYGLLRIAAIYGANASGKTNVLKALQFVTSAVQNSQRKWEPEGKIPRDPFRLDESETKPSSFDVEFVLNKVRYQYSFVLDSERVLKEWLHAYPQGKTQVWFTRDETGSEKRFSFGRHLAGENRAIEVLTRRNSLFLSAAAQNNHEMLLPVYNWFTTAIRFVMGPRMPMTVGDDTQELCRDEVHRQILLRLLSVADLGVSGFRLEEQEMPEEWKKFVQGFKGMFPKLEVHVPEKVISMLLQHQGRSQNQVEFPVHEESAGTVAFFSLLGSAVKVIESGGVLCVDELDSSLHPLLALELVRLFNDPKRNPLGAQLIFDTHDTNLLDNTVLRRDQIWFTEKDSEGATHLYPLSDFKPRKNENLEKGYLQGRYGAIPFVGDTDFILSRNDH